MGLYNMKAGVSSVLDLQGGAAALGMGVGNIYVVAQQANANVYNYCAAELSQKYADGSESLHTTIQSALNATVANRNDYVIVMPDSSDYDITAALTMTKRNVHLICPAGLGTNGFPTNAARIHQNTDDLACITVTGDCVEIAGFFFKGDEGGDIITLSGTRWHPNIHDNFFGIAATASSANFGIVGTGAVSHFTIWNNYFTNYAPGAMTGTDNDVAAFISLSSASSTRGLIRGNLLHTGANTTVAKGIEIAGYGIFILDNYLWEDVAFGASQAGVFTLGISNSVDCLVANNRIGIGTPANGVAGGTADQSYVSNYEGTNGATALV